MSFLDHLEELRWLLVRSTVAVLIFATVTFFVSDYIFDVIIFGPTDANFITYRFFCDLSRQLGFAESICVTEMPFIIQNTNMEGQINVLIWTCITTGFILGFPFILWEVLLLIAFLFGRALWLLCNCTHVCQLFCYVHHQYCGKKPV